jgi:hypothetical protein
MKYLINLESYLNSEKSFLFKSEGFVDMIVKNTILDKR